tara:strand:- start:4512 stop:5177 length:666 start_codon:yes stop_codon:yes gene_type:complete
MDIAVKQNRECLKEVKRFISKKKWLASGDLYGLPAHCFERIDLPQSNSYTYSDYIVYLINKYKLNNYLEIGISVLKNIYQVASNTKADIYAFDINPLNDEVKLPRDITFFRGNVVVKNDWRALKALNQKHDIIFSDALHSLEGIKAEYDNYYFEQHLADKWIIIYDDAYDHVVKHIQNYIEPRLDVKFRKQIVIEGWVSEDRHPIYIISNREELNEDFKRT